MLFNSFQFIIFIPIVLAVNYLIPYRIRYIWLLLCSYFFYMCWNAKYALLLFFSTLITYLTGILIQKFRGKRNTTKFILVLSVIVNIGILFIFKYLSFGLSMCQYVMNKMGIVLDVPQFDIVLPVGVSFFTFQALGYAIDVYRGDVCAERNFLKYALFVSFFPQLVAGPIERSRNLLKQLGSLPEKFSFDRFRDGIYLMLWGYFLKVVLADRAAIFADNIYGAVGDYCGWYLVIATILFAFQIYCDFGAYSTIALGVAKILGVELMENFDTPYLATSVDDFWRRWHISLTSWFRDYIYIPLGGNRKGIVRKHINRMIVFILSGLWHGASLSFVVWGGLNGIYQTIGNAVNPIRNKLYRWLHFDQNKPCSKIVSCIFTFALVDFSWIFFRAQSLSEAGAVIRNMFYLNNYWIMFDGSLLNCGLDGRNLNILVISLVILLVADWCKYRGYVIHKLIIAQDWWFRLMVIIGSVIAILVFGVWGNMQGNTGFIYFQF